MQTLRETLSALVSRIAPPDAAAMDAAKKRQAELAKPPGSLGRLEELSIRLAGMTGQVKNKTDKRRLLVFAADNGVIAEGVSSAPRSVTTAQTINIARGLTGAGTLARHCHTEVEVTDVGVYDDLHFARVLDRKIMHGTKNLFCEPAMTQEQALQALLVGAERAEQAHADGIQIIGVGEMGIGNTTTSSAVLSALTGLSVEDTVGKGGGLTDAAFQKKKQVISHALALHRPNADDPIDVLHKVGGLDIAAMAGAFLGAAACRMPAVVDGYISVVAALVACRLCPETRHYLILSHASYEIGYRRAAEELELAPLLLLDMRLGEGSGCPLAFQIVSAACAVMNEMATFAEAAIDDGYLAEIRAGEQSSFTVEKKQ